ncbi:uncharacterized protein B0T15DRAFT_180497 [Chaetomium strumarium]|uniref:Uncharacterized protein n=1 Tax=Chaetomium strumarium TaxID=1170767 RepID=A0AAJ0GX68_9PEZI|nr:hypothetical protein B0T15DRAFT_180497 [Chaetomium strumarium]
MRHVSFSTVLLLYSESEITSASMARHKRYPYWYFEFPQLLHPSLIETYLSASVHARSVKYYMHVSRRPLSRKQELICNIPLFNTPQEIVLFLHVSADLSRQGWAAGNARKGFSQGSGARAPTRGAGFGLGPEASVWSSVVSLGYAALLFFLRVYSPFPYFLVPVIPCSFTLFGFSGFTLHVSVHMWEGCICAFGTSLSGTNG